MNSELQLTYTVPSSTEDIILHDPSPYLIPINTYQVREERIQQ